MTIHYTLTSILGSVFCLVYWLINGRFLHSAILYWFLQSVDVISVLVLLAWRQSHSSVIQRVK